MDLHVKFNYAYPQQNRYETLEDLGGLHTEAEGETLPGGAGRHALPLGLTYQSLVVMLVLHYLLDCIYVVL